MALRAQGLGVRQTESEASGNEWEWGGARSGPDLEAGAPNVADMPLIQSLKRDWAKGKLSSPQVQEYALGAAKQGAQGMGGLAAAGSHGSNPQNLQRSLMATFGKPIGAPDFSWFTVPTASGDVEHPFCCHIRGCKPYTTIGLVCGHLQWLGLRALLVDSGRR